MRTRPVMQRHATSDHSAHTTYRSRHHTGYAVIDTVMVRHWAISSVRAQYISMTVRSWKSQFSTRLSRVHTRTASILRILRVQSRTGNQFTYDPWNRSARSNSETYPKLLPNCKGKEVVFLFSNTPT